MIEEYDIYATSRFIGETRECIVQFVESGSNCILYDLRIGDDDKYEVTIPDYNIVITFSDSKCPRLYVYPVNTLRIIWNQLIDLGFTVCK